MMSQFLAAIELLTKELKPDHQVKSIANLLYNVSHEVEVVMDSSTGVVQVCAFLSAIQEVGKYQTLSDYPCQTI